MVINKKALLYSLLAGSACIASHAWSMDNAQGNPIEGWTGTPAGMTPRSSSSSSQPTGYGSHESMFPTGDYRVRFIEQLVQRFVGPPAQSMHNATAAGPAPAVAHTPGETQASKEEEEEEEEEEEAGSSRKRKRERRR